MSLLPLLRLGCCDKPFSPCPVTRVSLPSLPCLVCARWISVSPWRSCGTSTPTSLCRSGRRGRVAQALAPEEVVVARSPAHALAQQRHKHARRVMMHWCRDLPPRLPLLPPLPPRLPLPQPPRPLPLLPSTSCCMKMSRPHSAAAAGAGRRNATAASAAAVGIRSVNVAAAGAGRGRGIGAPAVGLGTGRGTAGAESLSPCVCARVNPNAPLWYAL